MSRSVAFKCTYNDGNHGEYVGLRGTCSRDLIVHNVNHHVWCGAADNECRQFYEAGMRGRKPSFPCMESELFEKWRFNGGAWHNGRRSGEQIPVRYAGVGKIASLTTRKPDVEEKDRKIIGAYEIGDIDNEGNLNAHPDYRIRLENLGSGAVGFLEILGGYSHHYWRGKRQRGRSESHRSEVWG